VKIGVNPAEFVPVLFSRETSAAIDPTIIGLNRCLDNDCCWGGQLGPRRLKGLGDAGFRATFRL
jgi:hypothetical protein